MRIEPHGSVYSGMSVFSNTLLDYEEGRGELIRARCFSGPRRMVRDLGKHGDWFFERDHVPRLTFRRRRR